MRGRLQQKQDEWAQWEEQVEREEAQLRQAGRPGLGAAQRPNLAGAAQPPPPPAQAAALQVRVVRCCGR